MCQEAYLCGSGGKGPDRVICLDRIIGEVNIGLNSHLFAENHIGRVFEIVALIGGLVGIDDGVDIVECEVEPISVISENLVDLGLRSA